MSGRRCGVMAKKNEVLENSCLHNAMVLCIKRDCFRCGWNPAVEEKRKEKLKKGAVRNVLQQVPKLWRES